MNDTAVQKKSDKRQKMTGRVVSTKTAQMVVVDVTRIRHHPIYKKAMRTTKRFAAASGSFTLAQGDTVIIGEINPISKTKRFAVIAKL